MEFAKLPRFHQLLLEYLILIPIPQKLNFREKYLTLKKEKLASVDFYALITFHNIRYNK